jgi:hypothetical protein
VALEMEILRLPAVAVLRHQRRLPVTAWLAALLVGEATPVSQRAFRAAAPVAVAAAVPTAGLGRCEILVRAASSRRAAVD